MSVINTLFFELIRVAIGTQGSLSRLPSEAEWKALFSMAEKQSLVGICFAGLQQLGADADDGFEKIGMSEMQYLNWMSAAATIQERNETVNRQCVALQERLRADGIRNFIMKGQGNAALYGDLASFRQSGDIDVYLEGGLGKVLSYAKTVGETTQVNELEMHVNVFDDTTVEFHYKPFYMPRPKHDRILQAFLAGEMEECYANRICLAGAEGAVSVPGPAFNLVHQMAHIWHHFFTEGVGLRQLMDYCFVLKTRPSDKSRDARVVSAIQSLGLIAFAQALMWVMQEVFGLGREFALWEPDEEGGKVLLAEVMKSGNFGRAQDDGIMGKPAGLRFFAKIARAWRFRKFGRSAWFWIPVRSVADKAWQFVHGYK